jgi:hypothetical protein
MDNQTNWVSSNSKKVVIRLMEKFFTKRTVEVKTEMSGFCFFRDKSEWQWRGVPAIAAEIQKIRPGLRIKPARNAWRLVSDRVGRVGQGLVIASSVFMIVLTAVDQAAISMIS